MKTSNLVAIVSRLPSKVRTAAAAGFFLSVLGGLGYRLSHLINIPGVVDPLRWGLMDFRDALYYPVVSFLSGNNPYDVALQTTTYPVGQPFVLYSPLTLVVHLPFGLIPHGVSQMLYLIMTVLLTLALAYLAIRECGRNPGAASVLAVGALILASRPGHWNLLLGQTTLEAVFAVYVTVLFARRAPTISGLALVIATLKPTFGLPLALLMLCQGFLKPVLIGGMVAMAGTLAASMLVARSAGGPVAFVQSLWEGYLGVGSGFWTDPVVSPARIDLVALIARFSGHPPGPAVQVAVFLAVTASAGATLATVRRRHGGRQADQFCLALTSLAILLASYQQVYSALLLALPIASLATNCWAPPAIESRVARFALLALLMVPPMNYLSTFHAIEFLKPGPVLQLLWISANGLTIVIAFIIYLVLAFKPTRQSSPP